MNSSVLRILAVMLAVGAVLVGYYGYRMSKQAPSVTQPAPVQVELPKGQPILVAARNMPAGYILTDRDLAVELMPERLPHSYSTPAEIIGRQIKKDIAEGAVLLSDDFPSYSQLAQNLEPGERAMAVRVDEVVGTGGFVEPGDHVDILLYLHSDKEVGQDSSAQVLLSNVRVLAFGNQLQFDPEPQRVTDKGYKDEIKNAVKDNQDQEEPTGKKSKTAVLAIEEKKTSTLLLAETRGKLRLVVRGPEFGNNLNDEQELKDKAAFVSNIKNQVGKDQNHYVLLKELIPQKSKTQKTSNQSRSSTKVIVHKGHQTETQFLQR